MASYESIREISRTVWPAGSLAYSGTCASTAPFQYPEQYSTSYPSKLTLFFTPQIVERLKSDPTKGHRNWSKIKKSGQISFTPYSVKSKITDNFVIDVPHDFATWKRNSIACGSTTINSTGILEGHTVYSERIALANLSLPPGLGDLYQSRRAAFMSDVNDAISTTQQAAYAQAMSTYDLLTELAEAGETLKYMQGLVGGAANALSKFAHTDETTYKKARGLNAKALLNHSDKAFRRLGSRWMEYRYAIMPLIYAFKDVNELLGKKDSVYKTGRDKTELRFSTSDSDFAIPVEGIHVFGTGSMEAKVVSLVKSRYDGGALQRVLAQTSFNPFKTGWELIPWSFVIDWFLNVGDAITSATTIDLSTQTLGCTVVKYTENYSVIRTDTSVDKSTRTFPTYYTTPSQTVNFEFRRNLRQTLQKVTTESYERTVFLRPVPKVVFDPYLNWKRIVDGLVLSHQPIKKLLRSL